MSGVPLAGITVVSASVILVSDVGSSSPLSLELEFELELELELASCSGISGVSEVTVLAAIAEFTFVVGVSVSGSEVSVVDWVVSSSLLESLPVASALKLDTFCLLIVFLLFPEGGICVVLAPSVVGVDVCGSAYLEFPCLAGCSRFLYSLELIRSASLRDPVSLRCTPFRLNSSLLLLK